MLRRSLLSTGIAAAAAGAGLAWTKLHERRVAERHPPKGRFLDVDDVRLHYTDEGSGRPVVILHGTNGSILDHEFAFHGPARERYRVINFDRPGLGHSTRPRHDLAGPAAQAEIIHKALKQLGVERPLLVAHSWGGTLALTYARMYPDDISGMVLEAPWAYGDNEGRTRVLKPFASPRAGKALLHVMLVPLGSLWRPFVLRIGFHPVPVPTEYKRHALALGLRPHHYHSHAADVAVLARDARAVQDAYAEIDVPVGIVTGEHDRVVPIQHSERLVEDLPDATLRMLPETGHMVPQTRPLDVLAAVDDVWRRVDARASAPGDDAAA